MEWLQPSWNCFEDEVNTGGRAIETSEKRGQGLEALCPEPALPTDFWFCEVVNLFVAYANQEWRRLLLAAKASQWKQEIHKLLDLEKVNKQPSQEREGTVPVPVTPILCAVVFSLHIALDQNGFPVPLVKPETA